jgi:MFS family permease
MPVGQAFQFLSGSGRSLLPLFIGMAAVMLTFYAFNSWVPAILTRTYGISSGDIGQYLGVLVLLFGGSAIYLGGWITDLGAKNNKNDIYVKVMIISAAGIIPSVILLSKSSDLVYSLTFVSTFIFFSMLPNGVVVAYLNRVTPPQMRGLIGAVYILFCNLFGYMIGPSAVAIISERVFGGKQYIGESLAVVGASFALLALCLFIFSRRGSLHLIDNARLVNA